jgi:hypothetical protein
MMSEKINLTAKFCEDIKPKEKKFLVNDKYPGLFLKVTPKGFKTWVYKYRPKGREAKWFTVGPLSAFSPSEARKEVQHLYVDVSRGIDPNELKNKYAEEKLLGEKLKDYIDNSLTVSNGFQRTTIKTMRDVFDCWIFQKSKNPDVRRRYQGMIDLRKKKVVSDIREEHIRKLHKHIGVTSPIVANRLVAYLKMFYNSFLKKGQSNPCKIKKNKLFKEKEYTDFLSLPEFYRMINNAFRIDARSGRLLKSWYRDNALNPVSCLLIAFQLLTGRRTRSEASNIQWTWIKDNRLFLPKTKTSKFDTPTDFGLPPKALELLKCIQNEKEIMYSPGPGNKDWFRNRFSFPMGDERNKYVFPSRDFNRKTAHGYGKTPYTVDVRSTWLKLLKLSGIERHLKHYATRHTVASYILETRGDLKLVSDVLGVSLATAARYAKHGRGADVQVLTDIHMKIPEQQKLVG